MKMSVNHPDFEQGVEFEVAGLGAAPNGGSADLDDDAVAAYEAEHEMSLKDIFKDHPVVKVAGTSGSTQTAKGGES